MDKEDLHKSARLHIKGLQTFERETFIQSHRKVV